MAKVEIVETTKEKTFEPITFQVTIESADEFREMWHRMNLNVFRVIEESCSGYSEDHFKPLRDGYGEYESLGDTVWQLLDEYNDKQKKYESDCYIRHVTHDTSFDLL